jgi:hypothetical protein
MRFPVNKTVALAALLAIAPATALAQQNVIGPGGVRQPAPGDQVGNWKKDDQYGAFIDVTTANKRVGFGGYGNGSLEMSVKGIRDEQTRYFPEWGFFYRYAQTPRGFGSLANLSSLSFDWFRSAYTLPSPSTCLDDDFDAEGNCRRPIPPADWEYKTPVLRLLIQDKDDRLSELIWEGYYNQQAVGGIGGTTPVGTWVTTTQMHLGNFWYATPPATPGLPLMVSDERCGMNTFGFWDGGNTGTALQQLLGTCLATSEAIVVGIGVGVGSNWPLPWHGFVDNVRMGFTEDGIYRQAVDANFDFVPVPEPSTWALLGAGLLSLAAVRRRSRRRD